MARKSVKKGGCWKGGATCPTSGGKRHTRGRRMRGGAFGAGGPIAVGAMQWNSVDTATPVDPVSLAAKPDLMDVQRGARRRTRKTRKGKKGSKRTRKMKGGATQVSAMKAGYGFTGAGVNGIADAVETPTSGGNAF